MQLCGIVGCNWQPTADYLMCPAHKCEPMKAHEYGFTYYSATFWHQFCEPSAVYVSLVPGRAGKAADAGAEYERECCAHSCEDEACDGMCDWCCPVLCYSGEGTARVRDLFSPQELAEHRRELIAGGVVCLPR